jgi:hypothetical protein
VAPVRSASSERVIGTGLRDVGERRRSAPLEWAVLRRYLSASALITFSVMSIFWLA